MRATPPAGTITSTAPRHGADAQRQLADRIAVGVHLKRTIGFDQHLARAKHVHRWLAHVRAAEHPRQDLRQKRELADALEHDHLEQAVVEQRVGRRAHAAAIGLRVAGADRVGDEAEPLAGRVELDLKARRPPGEQRAKRAVGVDEPAEPGRRLVRDPVGVAVEADRGDADERAPGACRPRARHLAEVDRARRAVCDRRAGLRRSCEMPSTRARSLPRPPGSTPSTAPGTARSGSATAPIAPSPLSTATISPSLPPAARAARMREVARVDATHAQAVPAQRALGLGRDAPGLAAAGGGVDEQADAAAAWTRASLVGGIAGVRERARARARRPAAAFARSRRRRPNAAAMPSAAITTNRPSSSPGARPSPPNGSEISSTMPRPTASSTMISRRIKTMPRTRASKPAEAGRDQQSHRAQREQLTAGRRRLAEALDRALQIAGAAFGERERGVGHPPQLHPLLRPRRGDRSLEVSASLLGVEALGSARAEDRERGASCIWSRSRAPRRSAARVPGSPRGRRAARS